MKKTLIISLLTFLCFACKAQIYKPMSKFSNDTLQFMKYNFEIRKNVYVGKPLSVFLKDYEKEMPIKFMQTYMLSRIESGLIHHFLSGIAIDNKSSDYILDDHNKGKTITYVNISFAEPLKDYQEESLAIIKISDSTDGDETKKIREMVMYFKDYIVKDITIDFFVKK